MSLKCLMNGLEVNYPCSPTCALFGDCCTAFEAQRKSRVVTNADHIRAMSDKELADFLAYFNERICEHCACEGRCTSKCIRGVREWLKQPYEEDTHG